MLAGRKKEGVLYFYEEYSAYQGAWLELKQSSTQEVEGKRSFFRKRYGSGHKKNKVNPFVQKCAHQGLFDAAFTPEEIENAKKYGILPEEYDIHHIIPLSLGGTNEESNFCVIHRDMHTVLHQRYFNLIRDSWQPNEYPKAYFYTPTDLHFLTMDHLELFFSSEDCSEIRAEIVKNRKYREYKAKRRKEIAQRKKTQMQEQRFSKKYARMTPELADRLTKQYRHHKKVLKKQEEIEHNASRPTRATTYCDSQKYHHSTTKRMRRQDKDITD